MKPTGLSMIVFVALCATHATEARTHRAPKRTVAPASAPAANVPEKERHPDDIALDRKIKGICRGC